MFGFPVNYNEPLFRPPSEAYSVIIQATIGCSWNRCMFCDMYKTKKFKVREIAEIEKDIFNLSMYFGDTAKFFIADGDALVMSNEKLLTIFNSVRKNFKRVQRFSCYASTKNIKNKSNRELIELRRAGLKLVYIGIESGDQNVLDTISKGETVDDFATQINRIQECGIETSVTIINGLAGKKNSKNHAINSAKLINRINPKFLSVLALMLPEGVDLYKHNFSSNKKNLEEYEHMNQTELLEELKLFIEQLDNSPTIFRSDHASNYLVLKGTLDKNKDEFIEQINHLI